MLDWYADQLVSPDEQMRAQIQQSRKQATDSLAELHKEGTYSAVVETLAYELLPDECFALSLLAAESRRTPELTEVPSLSDLPGETNYFALPPEAVLERFAPEADAESLDRFRIEYASLITQYITARGRLTTIANCSHEAAISLGLIPPHELWLGRVWQEAEELDSEVGALNGMARDLFLQVIRGD